MATVPAVGYVLAERNARIRDVATLPARCNWLRHLALPHYDPARRLFCERGNIATPIGIMHLEGPSKNQTVKSYGQIVSLQYRAPHDWQARREGATVKDD